MVQGAPYFVIRELESASGSTHVADMTKGTKFTKQATGTYKCDRCDRQWDSGKISVDLCFTKGSRRQPGVFNICIFQQACLKCNKMSKARIDLHELNDIVERFAEVLTSPPPGRANAEQREDNGVVTKPHKQELCEKCRDLGRGCWERSEQTSHRGKGRRR